MCKTELEILEERVRKKRIDVLVSKGVIKPMGSFDEYSTAVQKAKRETSHKLFTNSYMMRAEVEGLIKLNMLYQIPISSGVGFVENQHCHWRLHLHIDLDKKLSIPKLEKSTLIEFVYSKEKESEQIKKFKEILYKDDTVHFYETYRGFQLCDTLSQEQCDSFYHAIHKSLEKEGAHICIPNDKQLYEFERIYRERIDIYTQSYFTMEERRQQRDKGLMSVVADKNDEVLAISLAPTVGGGAIAVRPDCVSNLYSTAFFICSLKERYDRGQRYEPSALQSKALGWVAVRNLTSIRLHKRFGIKWSDRTFDQFIIPGYTG